MNSNLTARTIFFVLSLIMIASCYERNQQSVYIPEMDVYLLNKRSFILNSLGKSNRARLYISRIDSFGSDYIDFSYFGIWCPTIYYVQDDGFYVEDQDSSFQIAINCKEFYIHYINASTKYREDSIETQTSFYIDKPHYTINFQEGASGYVIFNPKNELIYISH